jgi:hypothetical protein
MVLVPRPDNWTVLVHSKYIDEISRAPEDQLSFVDAASGVGLVWKEGQRPDGFMPDIPNPLQFWPMDFRGPFPSRSYQEAGSLIFYHVGA